MLSLRAGYVSCCYSLARYVLLWLLISPSVVFVRVCVALQTSAAVRSADAALNASLVGRLTPSLLTALGLLVEPNPALTAFVVPIANEFVSGVLHPLVAVLTALDGLWVSIRSALAPGERWEQTVHRFVESSHPYSVPSAAEDRRAQQNSGKKPDDSVFSQTQVITIPGASSLAITFDAKCVTEKPTDYLQLFTSTDRKNSVCAQLSGANFPGPTAPAMIVDGPTVCGLHLLCLLCVRFVLWASLMLMIRRSIGVLACQVVVYWQAQKQQNARTSSAFGYKLKVSGTVTVPACSRLIDFTQSVAWVTGAVAARMVNGGPLTAEETQVLTLGRAAVPAALAAVSSRDPAGTALSAPSFCC